MPDRIRGDREEIVQVLQNLIQNAIKYGREGGHIEVRVGRDAPRGSGSARVWVSVADDGPGIAPVHLPRLTERFYRVNVASSREKGGTGLGLAIVKHILNRHRGRAADCLEARRRLDLYGELRGAGRRRLMVAPLVGPSSAVAWPLGAAHSPAHDGKSFSGRVGGSIDYPRSSGCAARGGQMASRRDHSPNLPVL